MHKTFTSQDKTKIMQNQNQDKLRKLTQNYRHGGYTIPKHSLNINVLNLILHYPNLNKLPSIHWKLLKISENYQNISKIMKISQTLQHLTYIFQKL